MVAHLPTALRYAAVTAVAGRLIIAGGSLANGTASDAVLEFVPGAGRVVRVGRLPAPTTHAAAAAIGGVAYVIGGRGAAAGTPTRRIVPSTPRTRRIRAAGALRAPRSDLAAARVGGRILVAGGARRAGAVSTLARARARDAVAGATKPRRRRASRTCTRTTGRTC